MRDFYEILYISPEASYADIKKAYFSAVRKYPPDRFQDEFMKIREAYEVLSNEKTRQEYDLFVQTAADVREKIELSRQLIDEGDHTYAIHILEGINEIEPDILIVQSLLGEAYALNGNNGKAIKIFEKLVKKEPQNSSFAGQLAHAYLERGWHKKAIKAFYKALELDDDNIYLWLGLAEAFYDNHEVRLAKNTLLKALEAGKEKDWDNVTIYFHLIKLDIRMRELSDMEKHLEELTHIAMEHADIRENVGWSLTTLAKIMLSNQMFDEAKAMADKCVILLPDDKGILRMKEQVDSFSSLENEFAQLEIDESIKEEIVSFIAIDIFPEETLDIKNDQRDTLLFMGELRILEDFYLYRASIEKLKHKYPLLYQIKAEFFERALNAKERKKMLGRYRAEIGKYASKINQINDAIEAEMHPFDYFEDDDDDEDYDSDYDLDFEPQQPYIREEPKIGRNDPCPCGSGKKYKKCCGK